MLLFQIVATQSQNSEAGYCLSSQFHIYGTGTILKATLQCLNIIIAQSIICLPFF